MEFIAGSLVMAVAMLSFFWLVRNKIDRSIPVPRHSQSRAFSLAYQKLDMEWEEKTKKLMTQATEHLSKSQVQVVIHDSSAYWIQDQGFFTAKVVNGQVDPTTTRPVDTMSMGDVELGNISFIVEKLTERQTNDRRDPGNKKF